MNKNTLFWRDWWNEFGKRSASDWQADRGTSVRIDKLEQRAARQFLEAVDPKTTDVVLDAGCGSGVNLSRLSSLVAEIVGMDFSEEMIKRAERRIATEKLTNVRLMLGDLTQMEFRADTFDKVICTSVLQYLNDQECEVALQEMVRVCRSGGSIVIHLKNRTSLYGVSRMLVQSIARLIGRKITPDYYRPRAWYERRIAASGAWIVDCDSFGIFTFVPLPNSIVRVLVKLEMILVKGRWLKKFGVNYKMTVHVNRKERHGELIPSSRNPALNTQK